MAFNKEIESCLEQIKQLERAFQEAKEIEILPISFFSANYDRLNVLKRSISELEKKEPAANGFLGDKISKTLFADLKKSLSLNDRFRFQRDLFTGNACLMEETLDYLENLHSLNESIDYLNTHFDWNWDEESVTAFREILEKRFN
jgi:hypothetical protein